MTKKIYIPLLIIFTVWFSISLNAQTFLSLPRSTPEAEGVSSKDILHFIENVENSKHEFHSFMLLRHGKVISEGWWNPYKPELKHTMYSVSKSFTSTAIGFAVSEKRLTVNDKVISFFPNDLPDSVTPYLKELAIKDLLTMSAGQDPDPTSSIRNWNTNWVKSFLSTPLKNKPGTKFLYNSVATFMLSAIIQKVTGEKLLDYLKPRLFDPLGINDVDWEINPMNINTGGWGLRIRTEDLAKFGQLYLQKGKWNNKQLLPEDWIHEATTTKILQSPEYSQSKRDSSDWLQGYCYKFWRCRYGAFRGDGAFGQFIIVMPEQDAVLAITSESIDLQGELNLVWKYLLPAFQKNRLPNDSAAVKQLQAKLKSLALPAASGITTKINNALNKSFTFEPNNHHLKGISFQSADSNKICRVTIETDSAYHTINFGSGFWSLGQTTRLGPNLIGDAKFSFKGLPSPKIAGSYCWKNDSTIELMLRYIESPHSEKITCSFENSEIKLEFRNSINSKLDVVKGKLHVK